MLHALITLLVAVLVLWLVLELVGMLGLDPRATKIVRAILLVLFLAWLLRWFFGIGDALTQREQRRQLAGAHAQAVHPRRHALQLVAHARHPLAEVIEANRGKSPHRL